MAAVRVLFFVFCALAFNGLRVPGIGFIKDGGDYRAVARGQRAPRNANAVIVAAKKEIGVREVTENSSKRIDQYCAYVGFKKVAWCAAFCSWCFGQAGYTEPRTAWSPALFPKGRLARDALPGMVMGIYIPSMRRIAHCGIVIAVKGEWCETVEGNTNTMGSREGDGVMRKLRHKRTIAKYADWL
jgi:hypothetical protein